MSVLITDVSSNNGKIDFAIMKKQVAGVIIRAGYRGYSAGTIKTDAKYQSNIAAAEAVGLPVGVYWYTTAKSKAEAKDEADYLLKLIKGHKLSFPVFLDLEYAPGRKGRADSISAARRTMYAVTWLERVNAAGYDVGVYCNPDFWADGLVSDKLKKYARWIARYGAKCPVDCDMWQYTSTATGSLYGQSGGYIDASHCYTDFIGGATSKFAGGATTAKKEATKDMDTLRRGDEGQQVKVLQKLLGGLTVDGIFGAGTETAVKAYQTTKGLTADGICGPLTWDALLGD
jgi:GH25 family lysozyme M1 (1,4-beta-N-acetylmuramidase)